jgi:signal transduction histidine kinase
VWADADRLVQVLTNLLSNAIKFSPQGGEIVITVEHAKRIGRVTKSRIGQSLLQCTALLNFLAEAGNVGKDAG